MKEKNEFTENEQKSIDELNESVEKFLLKELLRGFTVTERGMMWYYTGKSVCEIAGHDFELMLTQYISPEKQAAMKSLYFGS